MEIALGHGNIGVSTVRGSGRIGVSLELLNEVHKVGDPINELEPTEQGAIIWFDGIDGARILQDCVAHAILFMRTEAFAAIDARQAEILKADAEPLVNRERG